MDSACYIVFYKHAYIHFCFCLMNITSQLAALRKFCGYFKAFFGAHKVHMYGRVGKMLKVPRSTRTMNCEFQLTLMRGFKRGGENGLVVIYYVNFQWIRKFFT